MGAMPNPYEAPRAQAAGDGVYAPFRWRTGVAQIGVVATVGVTALTSYCTLATAEATGQARVTMAAALGLVSLVSLGVTIATAVVVMMWMYRAAANVRAFHNFPFRATPGWLVASFFIPIISLYAPYQTMKEVWRASDPKTIGSDDTSWVNALVPVLFPIWWGTYLLHSFIATFGAMGTFTGATRSAEMLETQAHTSLVADAFFAVAAAAICIIMKQLAARQAACAEKLGL